MAKTLKDLMPDFSFEDIDTSLIDCGHLLKPAQESRRITQKKISIKELLKKFDVVVKCNSNILKLEFLDEFTIHDHDKYGRHRFHGKNHICLYEIFIDETNNDSFLEYHVSRLDHTPPNVIYIYNSKGELVLMT